MIRFRCRDVKANSRCGEFRCVPNWLEVVAPVPCCSTLASLSSRTVSSVLVVLRSSCASPDFHWTVHCIRRLKLLRCDSVCSAFRHSMGPPPGRLKSCSRNQCDSHYWSISRPRDREDSVAERNCWPCSGPIPTRFVRETRYAKACMCFVNVFPREP